jgi:chitodextrinase
MWGAAAPRRRLGALLAIVFAASLLAVQDSAAALPTAPDRLPRLSAVHVDRGSVSSLNRATLKRLRARGVNALVLRRGGLSARQQLRLTRLAARSNLMAFLPLVESGPSSWASVLSAAERCRALKRARPRSRCAVLARTITSARRLVQQEAVDLVVVRAKSTRSLRSLKALPGRVLAVRPLRPTPRFRSVWGTSIRLARSGRFDLAVAPSGREKRSTLIRYAGLLRRLTRVTDVRPPTTPKRLEVTSRGTATISLDWQSSRDNKSVVGYGVYRGGVLAATVPTPGHTLSGLECGTGYAFAVDAVDSAGNRSMKSALAASTHACSAKVYSMTPTDGAKVAGTLDWEAGVTNAEVSEIDFLIDGVHHWTERNAPYVRTWDTTDDVNGPHTLTLVASLSDGDTLTSSIDVTVDNGPGDTSAPSTPSGLVATGSTETSVSLSWNASSDNVGIAGYRVYRDGAQVATTTATSRTVSDLACGRSYTFAVAAYDAAGNTAAQASQTASTSACSGDTSAPSTPTSLRTTGSTTTSISLAWNASSDDVGVAGYRVYQSGSSIADMATTTHTAGGLACATSYTFGVEAFDAAGNVSGRAILNASTSTCPTSTGADVYLSPTGSDGNACTASAPCKSFDRAYRAAQLGDVVELAGGTYPNQVMEAKNAKSPGTALADLVVFRPAAGAAVKTGNLDIRVPHVEFRDMEIAKFKARYYVLDPDLYASGDLTFRNIKTHHFSLNSVQHVRVVNVDVGPNRNPENGDWPQDGIFVGTYPQDARDVTDILFDNVYVHDVTEPTSDAHSDCVQFTAGIDVIIRNSRFEDCEHADLMIKADQGPIDGFLIENNFFDRTLSAHFSINLYETSRGCRDVLIRNNTALQNIRSDACSGGTMTGNIQPSMAPHACSAANVELSWNVYESGVECGPNDLVAPVAFVNRANFDLRLASGSAAIDRGNPSSYPAKDIDGQARPKGGAPDAGAHERS